MNDIKYISFKDISLNKKIASLHINNMNDIQVRFDSLIEINVQDKVNYNRDNDNVRNLLLKVKYNNDPLFIGVEQGTGSKQDYVHMLFSLKLEFKARKQIENNYRTNFILENEYNY